MKFHTYTYTCIILLYTLSSMLRSELSCHISLFNFVGECGCTVDDEGLKCVVMVTDFFSFEYTRGSTEGSSCVSFLVLINFVLI